MIADHSVPAQDFQAQKVTRRCKNTMMCAVEFLGDSSNLLEDGQGGAGSFQNKQCSKQEGSEAITIALRHFGNLPNAVASA